MRGSLPLAEVFSGGYDANANDRRAKNQNAKQKPNEQSRFLIFIGLIFMDLTELQKLLRENHGRYVVFDNDKPDMVVFDAKQHQNLIAASREEDKKRILVTGGAGYIGSHAVAELLDNDYSVIVYDNLSTGRLDAVNCPVVVGDLNDKALLDKVFAENDIDAVLHFAASLQVEESVYNPNKYFQDNVGNSLNLFDAMVRHGVKKLIHSSSAAVYGNPAKSLISEEQPTSPINPYGATKLMVEDILKWYMPAHNLSSVSLRYFNACGGSPERGLGETRPFATHLIPRVLRVANKQDEILQIYGSDYPTMDGTAVRDYIHVKDLAKAHVLALKKLEADAGAFTYNVGTGKGISVAQIVDAVVEITRRMVPIERAPRRAGDPAALIADNRKIADELGFKPEFSDIESIVSSSWEWHKKYLQIQRDRAARRQS
jgi:UDP-glucose 4-epimerase